MRSVGELSKCNRIIFVLIFLNVVVSVRVNRCKQSALHSSLFSDSFIWARGRVPQER